MATQVQQRTVPNRALVGGRDAAGVDLRVPGVLIALVGAAFLTVTMLAASIAPGYDFNAAAISDLGVIDQTALLFNSLLIVVGALNILAGYFLYRWHGRRPILALYLLGGVGAAGAGVVPLDRGDLHSIFALLGFLFFNVEVVATGFVLAGPLRILSFLAGAVGIVYVVVMIIGDSGNAAVFGAIGHGGAERMIVYPAMLWTLAVGGYLMAKPVEQAGPKP